MNHDSPMADRIRRIREHLKRGQAVYREPDEPTPADVRRAIERDRRLIDRRTPEDDTMSLYQTARDYVIAEPMAPKSVTYRFDPQPHWRDLERYLVATIANCNTGVTKWTRYADEAAAEAKAADEDAAKARTVAERHRPFVNTSSFDADAYAQALDLETTLKAKASSAREREAKHRADADLNARRLERALRHQDAAINRRLVAVDATDPIDAWMLSEKLFRNPHARLSEAGAVTD